MWDQDIIASVYTRGCFGILVIRGPWPRHGRPAAQRRSLLSLQGIHHPSGRHACFMCGNSILERIRKARVQAREAASERRGDDESPKRDAINDANPPARSGLPLPAASNARTNPSHTLN